MHLKMERLCVHAKKKCGNTSWLDRDNVYDHLVCNGFARGYTCWIFHGESILDHSVSQNQVLNESSFHESLDVDERDNMQDMLQETFGYSNENAFQGFGVDVDDMTSETPNIDTSNFCDLVRDCNCELYPGCKSSSKLSFIIRLYHIKCMSGWSNKSFSLLLDNTDFDS